QREGCARKTIRSHLHALGVALPLGAPRKHPKPDPRPCAWCRKSFEPAANNVARGWGETCSLSCRMKLRWATGNGIAPTLLENASAAAGRNLKAAFKSRWSGRSGRPKTIDEASVQRVLRLHAKGYSVRQIAEQT